jgi:hypothetical protein
LSGIFVCLGDLRLTYADGLDELDEPDEPEEEVS